MLAGAKPPVPVLSESIGGLRGPVHMGLYYSEILLEIVNHLCSDAAGKFAHGNREGSYLYVHTYIHLFDYTLIIA